MAKVRGDFIKEGNTKEANTTEPLNAFGKEYEDSDTFVRCYECEERHNCSDAARMDGCAYGVPSNL